MKLSLIFAILTAFGAAACASAPETDLDTQGDLGESEGELSAAGRAVVGAYDDDGNVQGLVLNGDGSFFLELRNSIRCVRAPCPSNFERVEGKFTAGAKTVTLRADNASDPSGRAKGYLGRFRYTKVGDDLTLTKGADRYELKARVSYCGNADDCYGQSIIVPACLGQFRCTADSSCSYRCGNPPPLDPCRNLEQDECLDKPGICEAQFGPSSCTPPPNARCTRDFVFKSCKMR